MLVWLEEWTYPAVVCYSSCDTSEIEIHVIWRAGRAQWWECSPPTNVSWVWFLDSESFLGWVCCWFSTLLREVFLRVLQKRKPTFPNSNSSFIICIVVLQCTVDHLIMETVQYKFLNFYFISFLFWFFLAMIFCAETQDPYSPVSYTYHVYYIVQYIVTMPYYSMCALWNEAWTRYTISSLLFGLLRTHQCIQS